MTLHERLAPLREETPTDADVAAVFAAVPRTRPRRRLALGLVTATAAVAVAIAALPANDPDDPVALLNAAAATAADEPPAFTGYRYTKIDERFGDRRQHVENWVDRSWQGRAITDGREREFMYGDGPLLDLDIAALPTEPKALLAALEANERALNWAPGLPTPDQVRYDVTRSILLLLGTANTTPHLRAGLWGALALLPGLKASDAKDPLGREGEAVTLPAPPNLPVPAGVGSPRTGTFTVIFDPDSSELLSWSQLGSGGGIPDQVHTFVRAGHVRNLGDRPR
ncbi:hypothetical protein [Solirubrobacter soli]|uniref:hypothetical protein n=1 Tax=Solirubrobacter soli TaxID=363832 RepID=UPI00040AE5F7|nr:hypothetical protein [Solirubrobacter soli]